MKLLNKTNKDLMIPVRTPKNESGVYQPINHLVVKKGEWENVPERAVKGAKMMGMVVKAEESSIGEVVVETKQVKEDVPEQIAEKDMAIEQKEKYTEKQLFDMTKLQQIDILKSSFGQDSIPRYEKDRVKLILELGGK